MGVINNQQSLLSILINHMHIIMPFTPNRHVGQQRVPSTSGDPLPWTWCPPRSSPSPLFPSQLSVAMWSWGDPACVSLPFFYARLQKIGLDSRLADFHAGNHSVTYTNRVPVNARNASFFLTFRLTQWDESSVLQYSSPWPTSQELKRKGKRPWISPQNQTKWLVLYPSLPAVLTMFCIVIHL